MRNKPFTYILKRRGCLPNRIDVISGALPSARIVHHWDVFTSTTGFITDLRTLFIAKDEDVCEKYNKLSEACLTRPFDKEKLISAYREVLLCEMIHGLVRIPVACSFYDAQAIVKSEYSDREYNYSPQVKSVLMPARIDSIAEACANFVMGELQGGIITAYYKKRAINENDLENIFKAFDEVCEALNSENIEEYNVSKDDETYRHRSDINWDEVEL